MTPLGVKKSGEAFSPLALPPPLRLLSIYRCLPNTCVFFNSGRTFQEEVRF